MFLSILLWFQLLRVVGVLFAVGGVEGGFGAYKSRPACLGANGLLKLISKFNHQKHSGLVKKGNYLLVFPHLLMSARQKIQLIYQEIDPELLDKEYTVCPPDGFYVRTIIIEGGRWFLVFHNRKSEENKKECIVQRQKVNLEGVGVVTEVDITANWFIRAVVADEVVDAHFLLLQKGVSTKKKELCIQEIFPIVARCLQVKPPKKIREDIRKVIAGEELTKVEQIHLVKNHRRWCKSSPKCY